MAKLTKNEEYIVDMYVRYFGRAADTATIATYAEDKKTSVILKNIIADADAEKGQIETADFVNNAFQNLFGRIANTKEMNKYSKVIDAGKDLPINSIVKSAAKTDKKVYDNKKAVALKYAELGGTEQLDLSKISKDNIIELNFLNTVTKAADLKAKVGALPGNSGVPSSFDGKTFVLTTSVDTGKDFVGTAKNDEFIASDAGLNGTTPTWTVADTIDGGKGTDGLTIVTTKDVKTVNFENNTMKSIEIVDINAGGADIDLDTTQAGKVAENFKAVTDLKLTTTGTGTITVVGGKNIVAKAAGAIAIDEDTDATTAATIEKITIDSAGGGATIGADSAASSVDALKELTVKNGVAAQTVAVTTAVETLKVNLDNSAATSVVNLLDPKLKTLNVDASGKESSVDFNTSSTILETINISGNAKLTLEGTGATDSTVITTSNVKEINVTNTKGVVIQDQLNINTKFTGGAGADSVVLGATTKAIAMGAGDDTVTYGGALGTGGLVDAGAGKDTIKMNGDEAGSFNTLTDNKFNNTFSNFEVLEIYATGAGGADTIDTRKINNVSQVTVAAGLTTGSTINNLANLGTVKFTVDQTASNNLNVNIFEAYASTANVLNLELSSTGAAAGAGIAAETVTAAGAETININSDDTAANPTGIVAHTLTLAAADATSVVVTGDTKITVNAAAASTKIATFDASTAKADVIFAAAAGSVNNVTIKGGAGNDTLTGSTLNDTIIGGAGNDTLNGGTGGVDTLTGGAGADKFEIIAQNTTTVGIDKITDFVAGVDKIVTDTTVANQTAANSVTDLRASDLSASANVGVAADQAMKAAAAGTAGDVVLFTYQSKVYAVVESATAAASFNDGTDFIVEITGVTGTVTVNDFLV